MAMMNCPDASGAYVAQLKYRSWSYKKKSECLASLCGFAAPMPLTIVQIHLYRNTDDTGKAGYKRIFYLRKSVSIRVIRVPILSGKKCVHMIGASAGIPNPKSKIAHLKLPSVLIPLKSG